MADSALNAGGGGGPAPALEFTPEEAAKCVKFVRAIMQKYGTTAVDIQNAVTDMDEAGEHYAVRFAEKMKEIDRDEWGIYSDEEEPPAAVLAAAAAAGEVLLRGTKGEPKVTKVYEVITPRTTPPRVRFVGTHPSVREALDFVATHTGKGGIPDLLGAHMARYMTMMSQMRNKGNVFFKGTGHEFMVIPDKSKDEPYLKEGVHHVVV